MCTVRNPQLERSRNERLRGPCSQRNEGEIRAATSRDKYAVVTITVSMNKVYACVVEQERGVNHSRTDEEKVN